MHDSYDDAVYVAHYPRVLHLLQRMQNGSCQYDLLLSFMSPLVATVMAGQASAATPPSLRQWLCYSRAVTIYYNITVDERTYYAHTLYKGGD